MYVCVCMYVVCYCLITHETLVPRAANYMQCNPYNSFWVGSGYVRLSNAMGTMLWFRNIEAFVFQRLPVYFR